MYAKGNHNTSFSATIEYNFREDKLESIVLHSDDLRIPMDALDDYGKQALIRDFEEQASYRRLAKPCGHTIIGIGEKGGNWEELTTQQKQQFCLDFIKEKGFENTQYIFVSHKDTDHSHLHLIYNRIDNDGKGIHQDKNKIDNELIGYKLSEKYNLPHPEASRNWIQRELQKDSKYIDTVLNRELSGSVKVKALEGNQIVEIKANHPLLDLARNQHHLGKLAQANGVSFRELEDDIYLDHLRISKEDLSAVYKSNREKVEDQKQEQRLKVIKETAVLPNHQLKINKALERNLRQQQKPELTEQQKRMVKMEDLPKQHQKQNENQIDKKKGLSL
jgi:hypothetical protein